MNWTQLGLDIDGEAAGDQSGYSVSSSSDGLTVAIGAPYNVNGKVTSKGIVSSSGQVRVYKYSGSEWKQLGQDIDGQEAGDHFGYSVSLSSDGKTVAIGDPYNSSYKGQVRVYQYSNSKWNPLGGSIYGDYSNDHFGWSVSLSENGTTVAIGAIFNSSIKGEVKVYQYSNSKWNQLGQNIYGEVSMDESGYSVSLSGDGRTVAIGAPNNNGNKGQVRVYQYSNSKWNPLGGDIDGEAVDGEVVDDNSGASVSLSKNGLTVAIGAPRNDGIGSNAGQVRVYQYSGSDWLKLGPDIDGESYDESGSSVSLSGDGTTVAIGAPYNNGNGNGTSSGQVRVYKYDGSDWLKLGQDIDGAAKYDQSGSSVSLNSDGTTVAIGSFINGGYKGQVRVYKLQTSSNNSLQSQQPTYSPPFQIFNNELDFGDFENGGFTGIVKNPEPPITFNAMRFFYKATDFKGMGIDASKLREKKVSAKTLKRVGFLEQDLRDAGFKNDEI